MAKPTSYDRWDKFDADAEIERMEEEERKKQRKEAEKKAKTPDTPSDFLDKFSKPKRPDPPRRTQPPVAVSNAPLRACTEDTLHAVAKELSLDPELIKLVARAMFFSEAQLNGLPPDARAQTVRMRTGPEFEKVRFAIRRMAAEEEKAAQAPAPKKKTVTKLRDDVEVPGDDPQVMAAMHQALLMNDVQIEGLSEMERTMVTALRTDDRFAASREKVKRALGMQVEINSKDPKQKAPAKASTSVAQPPLPKDPLWDGSTKSKIKDLHEGSTLEETIAAAAAEAGFNPQVIEMCAKSMKMTPEQVEALPAESRQKVKMVREDPDFAPLRKAAQSTLEAEEAVDRKLHELAAEMGLDPEGIRACAQAMQMTEEEVEAISTQRERDAMKGIRTSEMFAPIREICVKLGLVPGQKLPLPADPKKQEKTIWTPNEVPEGEAQGPSDNDNHASSVDSDISGARPEGSGGPLEPDPAILELCAQALSLSEAELQALPESAQDNFRAIREEPEFEGVRNAVQDMGLVRAPTSPAAPVPTTTPDAPASPACLEQRPKWKLSQISSEVDVEEGEEAEPTMQVVAKIELPLLENIKGVEVNITERQIYVHKPDVYKLELQLPYAVDTDAVQAKWLKKQRVLQVTMTRL